MGKQLEKPDLILLREFARTDRQREVLEALIEHGSQRAAAKALGTSQGGVSDMMARIQRRASMQGFSPEHDMRKTAPETHYVSRTTSLYKFPTGEDGGMALQWVRRDVRRQQLLDLVQQIIADMVDDELRGLAEPTEPPVHTSDDWLATYIMGDPHLGMYAWAEEAGEDFDLKIACRHLYAASDHLIESSPDTTEALIVDVGDFYHADTPENRTKQSNHPLDTDTRHAKVFRAGWQVMYRIIGLALRKHQKVTVCIVKGNHDPESSFALAEVLRALFQREPRVEIIGGIGWHHYYEFGKNLIGMTHGDQQKPQDLPGIMSANEPQAWGRTRYRYWITGHIHHKTSFQFPGCQVESYNTLAARDAWHASKGYADRHATGRSMTCEVYHREFGRKQTHVIGVPEIEATEKEATNATSQPTRDSQ